MTTATGEDRSEWAIGGGGYLSANDPRLNLVLANDRDLTHQNLTHETLTDHDSTDQNSRDQNPVELEMHWPGGSVQRHRLLNLPSGHAEYLWVQGHEPYRYE